MGLRKLDGDDAGDAFGSQRSGMRTPVQNRDRGEPRGSSPPTPPDIRARIRRFSGLCGLRCRDGSQAE